MVLGSATKATPTRSMFRRSVFGILFVTQRELRPTRSFTPSTPAGIRATVSDAFGAEQV